MSGRSDKGMDEFIKTRDDLSKGDICISHPGRFIQKTHFYKSPYCSRKTVMSDSATRGSGWKIGRDHRTER